LLRAAEEAYGPPSTFAFGSSELPDWEAAFECLSKATDARDPLVVSLKTLRFIDFLRLDQGYPALFSNISLPP
jgi:hypothetical protein